MEPWMIADKRLLSKEQLAYRQRVEKMTMADVMKTSWGGKDYPGYEGYAVRQYFHGQLADSAIVAASITPGTTKTFLFTQAQSLQFLPLPYGQSAPFAGQIFRFAMGGLITTPATGTLTLEMVHGNGASSTTGGTTMGAGPAQTVTASLSNQMWTLQGYICYRLISTVATSSTAWLTGTFCSQGTLATAGGGWNQSFGSTAAVSVDTTGTGTAGTFGGLNLFCTFSVTGATISAQWTSMEALN